MKLSILGGGGFRTPLLYRALARIAGRLGLEEIVLHDVAEARLSRMEAVILGLAREGPGPSVRVTTDLDDALHGASAVFCAIRVGGLEARVIDERVPLELGVLGQETTGPGGICFALRTLPVVLELAEATARLAPGAWFVNFTNPAGLVTEALRDVLGDRVVGVCDSPSALCRRVARALGAAPDELWFDYFGLNHLGWLRAVRSADGDRLPALLRDESALRMLFETGLFGGDRLRDLGMIPNEYLAYYEDAARIVEASRARPTRAEFLLAQQSAFYGARPESPERALESWRRTKAERNRTYMAEARPISGGQDEDGSDDEEEEGYGRVAARFLCSVASNTREVMILDVPNRSSLPFLDHAAVVEVPCVVGAPGPVPVAIGPVPYPQREMIERLKEVERITIRAALTRSAELATQAMAAHPVVGSRELAERILGAYRRRHPWLRRWSP